MSRARLLLATLLALAGCGACGELVALTGGAAEGRGDLGDLGDKGYLGDKGAGPQFAARQQRAVRGVLGGNATLECRVLRLGDKAVSWVRMRDLQILAHAGIVFTADARVLVPSDPRGTHRLRIGSLRASDAGRYECQVNTEPKMSLLFDLEVLEEVLPSGSTTDSVGPLSSGGEAGVVRGLAGGRAELACEALGEPPPALRWTRDGRPVALHRATVLAESGSGRAVSRLRLSGLRLADAGSYECRSENGPSLELRLVVDEPEYPEAMQRDQATSGAPRGERCAALVAIVATMARRL